MIWIFHKKNGKTTRLNFATALMLLSIFLLFFASCGKKDTHKGFQSHFPQEIARHWVGPDFWANRLQDWQINSGRLECINGTAPLRTVHLLSGVLKNDTGSLEMSVHIGKLSKNAKFDENSFCGFLIGAGNYAMDYRRRALIHQAWGNNGGIVAAINGDGKLVFLDNQKQREKIILASAEERTPAYIPDKGLEVRLKMTPQGETYQIELHAFDYETGELLSSASVVNIEPERLSGNVALTAHGGFDETGASFWFKDWKVKGSKIEFHPEWQFGPVLGVQYTLNHNTLNLTAQMPPLADNDSKTLRLEIAEKGSENWQQAAEAQIVAPQWLAHFRMENWQADKDFDYRLIYTMHYNKNPEKEFVFRGSIKRQPTTKQEIVVAAFTGNSNSHGSIGKHFDFSKNALWFPHNDIVQNVEKHQPDFLVFTGDQVYEGRPTHPDYSSPENSRLDYLYKWYLWHWAYNNLTRNRPTVCMPDDHDVYHGNIWGAGGKKAQKAQPNDTIPQYYKGFMAHYQQDRGGYKMPPDFVNMVQATQTAHLPKPFDPTPVKQGIGVYYTSIAYGGISFAVLEDRKFKSAPSVVLPEAKVVNGFSQLEKYDAREFDVPQAKLLGERQLKFLDHWAKDWNNVAMKVALSQSIFANLSTYPDSFRTDAGTPQLKPLPQGKIPKDYKMAHDMDSNGWPQTGRNKALKALRKGYALMIGGDQHLGSVIHHGVEDWRDAGISFCVPSIANLWPRRWFPPKPGKNHQPAMPEYTGDYTDGFGNLITVWAVSNPYISEQKPATLHDRAPGYGIVKLNKKTRKITMECWPRYQNPKAPDAKQYPGWPVTISQEDNFGKKAVAHLPRLKFSGLKNPPVVQVIYEKTGETIYTLRAKKFLYRPKVFAWGYYTLKAGNPEHGKMKELNKIPSVRERDTTQIEIKF